MRYPTIILLFCTLMMMVGCKKKRAAAVSTFSEPLHYDRAAAERLGFVAYLPKETEACLAVTHLSSHLLALSRTAFYKELQNERGVHGAIKAKPVESVFTPKPQVADSVYQRLHGRDAVVAISSGGHEALTSLLPLWRMNLELMSAELADHLLQGKPWKDLLDLERRALDRLAKNEVKRDEWLRLLAESQVPPLVLSVKTPDGAGLFDSLFPSQLRQQWKQQAKVGQVAGKYQFQFVEGGLGKICPEAWLPLLKSALKSQPKTSKAAWYATLEALSKKRVCLSFGQVGDHAVLMIGAQRPSFHFADPGRSLLQQPELAAAASSGESLIAHGYCNQQLRNMLKVQESVPAAIQGMLSSVQAQYALHDLAQQWATVGAAWLRTQSSSEPALGFTLNWENGLLLRTQSLGSSKLTEAKTVQFSNLLHGPHTVAVWNGRHTDAESRLLRQLVTVLSKTILQGAQHWFTSHSSSDQKTFSTLEQQLLPSVGKLAASLQSLYTKALGNEHALILDWQNAGPAPWPELAEVWGMQDRHAVSTAWQRMDTATQEIFTAFSTAPGVMLPEPEAFHRHEMDFYHYPLKFSAERTPCVALNDQRFILSSSRVQCESLATRLLQKPNELDQSDVSWKINAQLLRDMKLHLLPAQKDSTESSTAGTILSYLHSITSRSKTTAGSHLTETLMSWSNEGMMRSVGMN